MRQGPGDHHLLAFAGRQRLDRRRRRRRAVRRCRRPRGRLAGSARALRNSPPARGASESSVRLSATVVPGTMPASISWWTVWMPARRASSGVAGANGSPPTSTVPPEAPIAPERILISVDLPAPLVPMRPTTSPAATSKETSAEDLARSVALGQLRDPQRRRRRHVAGVTARTGPRSARSLGAVSRATGSGRGRACSVPERRRSAG